MSAIDSHDRQFRFAIEHKRLIEVRYEGRLRVAEPHDYGVKNGRPRLLVYQLRVRGGHEPDARGWRLLDVSKISICAVCHETFAGSREQESQRHFTWGELYARVSLRLQRCGPRENRGLRRWRQMAMRAAAREILRRAAACKSPIRSAHAAAENRRAAGRRQSLGLRAEARWIPGDRVQGEG
jgi:hypothetical protein